MSKKEILRASELVSLEALTILLSIIAMLIISIAPVEADDDESIWQSLTERGQIELVLDDSVNLEAMTGLANELALNGTEVAQAQVETDPEPLVVQIPNGVNVRSIDSGSVGMTDTTFPRGNTEVVGWFDSVGTPLNAIASGTWIVLEGGTHAVYAPLIREADGSTVTDAEAQATTEYEYNGSEFVPVVPVVATEAPGGDDEVEPEAAPEPDEEAAPTDEPETTGTPDANEALSFPELPDQITVTYPDPINGYRGEMITETIEINQDSLLPIPLGLVEEGQFEATDAIANWEADPANENWERIPLSGIVLDVTSDPQYPDDIKHITLLTETPSGQQVFVRVSVLPFIYFRPLDDNLNLAVSEDEAGVIYHISTRLGDDTIEAGRTIVPGDHIVVDIVNIPDGEMPNSPFASWRTNQNANGLADGTPTAVWEAADEGEIDNRDVPYLNVWGAEQIIYNQD